MDTPKTIYEAMKRLDIPMDSHESDLYVKMTPGSIAICKAFNAYNTSLFRSEIDHSTWIDIPFAYQPFWDKVSPRNGATSDG